MKKVLLVLAIAAMCSSSAQALYRSGTDHGFWWSTWYDDIGSLSISFDGAGTYPGAFQIRWSNVHNGGGGKGWQTGGYKTIGYNCSSLSGYVNFGIYGWTTNPLIEFYISDFGNHGGTNCGTLSSDGGTYTVYKQQRVNAPSIIGTATFWQYKSDRTSNQTLNANHTITCGNHFNYWKSHCGSMGSFGEMKLNVEAFSSSNSATGQCYANVWESGGGSSTTTTTTSASTTTTTTSGSTTTTTTSGGGGGSCTLTLRARSTDGQGKVRLIVGGNTVGDWTLSSSMSNYSVTLWSSRGNTRVEFYNDASGRDVQVDYLSVCGSTRQAESRGTNTAVYQNGSCGGSNSEWMHCNGYIDFGDTSY
jgi:hypothetical protein